MKNCPNCNAPIDPNKCKCDYCGTYYFDFSGLDLTGNRPCFIKVGNITAKAIPRMGTMESHTEDDVYYDITGHLHRYAVSQHISMEVRFEVLEYKMREANESK